MRSALFTALCAWCALAGVHAQRGAGAHSSSTPDVANKYIVTFTPEATSVQMEVTETFILEHGGEVRSRFRTVLKGFSAYIPPEIVAQVEANDYVERVEAEQVMSTNKGGFGFGGH
eukprot:CAMPEP_0119409852 /NCGR_PEP_ID=MMETSP1335-20130426/3031_1 /TAXON_ID=259385 /ORGANISM="Chrysoculter rhomboideus, Strain RCC1486" /LENGTH=115 /DNA_ID=CAMNT_0007434287 /DNA_START=27 /DNA_END=374 /DNA_ORIENTATION=-